MDHKTKHLALLNNIIQISIAGVALKSENDILFMIIILIFFITINKMFIKEFKNFITIEHSSTNIFNEFKSIVINGLTNIFIFTTIYYHFGLIQNSKLVQNEFLTSLYFSIVTWTTLGYGDYSPIEELRLIASIEALMGYVYMALFVGLFLNIIQIKRKDEV